MGKVFYYYGTMKSSKTANLLMVYHNYVEKGIKPILVKPSTDTRSGNLQVSSRVGISEVADFKVPYDGNSHNWVYEIMESAIKSNRPILLDECQFFSKDFVKELCSWAHDLNKPVVVMAYGLLLNFGGDLFEGSKAWIENCDSLREVKTICKYCGRKATHNVLFINNKPTFDTSSGDTFIGDTEYEVVCSEHWEELHSYTKNQSIITFNEDFVKRHYGL